MEILAFTKIPNYEKFTLGSHKLLESTVSEFLSVKVNLQICSPEDIRNKFGIDITANIKQSLYPLSEGDVLLISHVKYDEDTYFIGLLLHGKALTAIRQNRILNYIAGAISKSLQECVDRSFYNAPVLLNERLIQRMISSHIATSGNYNRYQISFLIDKVKSLMTTTFEGKKFSTGMIITKSLPRYLRSDDYPGKVITLRKKKDLYSPIDNRVWYLADGIDSFYLSGVKDFSIQHIYITLDTSGELQKMKPHTILKGADTILRVYGGREMSVITRDMIEFIYQENVWRYRDYEGIKQLVMAELPTLHEGVYDSLISFILYCSKNEISTIIWIPEDETQEALDRMLSSSNPLDKESDINICNESNEVLMKRILSSDGACIISKTGTVLRYGCIIKDTVNVPSQSTHQTLLKGTGETAASRLAANGISFKVSQDGTIKFYHSPSDIIRL